MAILRVRSNWTGFNGGPGYTSHHFLVPDEGDFGAASAAQRVRAFWESVKFWLPQGVSIRIDPQGELYELGTGQLRDYTELGDLVPTTSGTDANYAGGVGAVCHWLTGTVVNGRRIRGRTFLVPLTTTSYDNTGTLTPNLINAINTGAAALLDNGDAPQFVVWKRNPIGTIQATAGVTGFRVPDKAAQLRTRRD